MQFILLANIRACLNFPIKQALKDLSANFKSFISYIESYTELFCTFANQQISKQENDEIHSYTLLVFGINVRQHGNPRTGAERKRIFFTHDNQRTESLLHIQHV